MARPVKPFRPGARFGKLQIQCEAFPRMKRTGGGTYRRVYVLCDCGVSKVVRLSDLRRKVNAVTSCGCVDGKPKTGDTRKHRKGA